MSDKSATAEELAALADLLERVAEDRGMLADMPEAERLRLLKAASQVAMPDRGARRKLRKAHQLKKQAELNEQREADRQRLGETGIRSQFEGGLPAANGGGVPALSGAQAYSTRRLKKPEPPAPFEPGPAPQAEAAEERLGPRLEAPRTCYICKASFDRVHTFYDAMCAGCAEFNWAKRHQTADLTGRVAVVTGGRVKIGYQAALKLLRAGAHVVVTTRFPRDGAQRFLAEPDAEEWRSRLELQGLDLRHTPSVEALADHLCATLPRLDFLLNNACQTVRRPPGFYAHLMEGERQLAEELPAGARPLLESYEELRSHADPHAAPDGTLAHAGAAELAKRSVAGILQAAELSQLELAPGDDAAHSEAGEELFPTGRYDVDRQQVDLRKVNSWRLRLAEVPTVELLEVQLVNAIAPFVLNARLKPLMQRVPTHDKHIVNVSAMEGIFYRAYKTDKHPHTNMAKAALNMLTRTSAQDYARDGIHMNSVDTGWITDEDPDEIAKRKKANLDFHPPLDIVDAAARICDPYLHGQLTGEHAWGKFYKDYRIANW
ncbi:Fatty acyl-CoA reductase [Pseudobythopirellula maris]|uniref:Fatty acyl-CoA reductase n=1 Tax=Pseudobythopirellula maris TaxID=2527991 RepID=A0A5C5ZUG5_9BACT|nr:SDR family NAD(P)-dependent oxidoreductase [Pseudobythopirellula maris]TWT90551.1 Fatty acyl-CoA reductase [Pseudobythopirellula maris]